MSLRPLLALALAVLLTPAAAHAAPAAQPAAGSPTTSTAGGLAIGGFIGYETDNLSGISLRLDGEWPLRALSPQVNLSWVGSIGYSHLTESRSTFGLSEDVTANILKIIPAARFSFPLNPQFTIFGDAGLGVYYASIRSELAGFPSSTDHDFHILMRIGAGTWYALNPSTRIGGALEFDPYFGDLDQTTFIIQAGIMFNL